MTSNLAPMYPILQEVQDMLSNLQLVIRPYYEQHLETLKYSGSHEGCIEHFFQLEEDLKTLRKLSDCISTIIK